jgi:hypothetical protein
LKKSYPNEDIPEFSIHSDYRDMKLSYDSCLKRISISNSADKYKTYLIGAFMLIEFVLGKYMKFDMEGYAQQQIQSMSSYEKLLIELGEKQYIPEDQQWPVEARLLFMIIINTGVFLMGKMILNKTGANLMGMINNMNIANNSNNSNNRNFDQSKKKRKMRGPNIDLDNL